jgi:hypothetical protein
MIYLHLTSTRFPVHIALLNKVLPWPCVDQGFAENPRVPRSLAERLLGVSQAPFSCQDLGRVWLILPSSAICPLISVGHGLCLRTDSLLEVELRWGFLYK